MTKNKAKSKTAGRSKTAQDSSQAEPAAATAATPETALSPAATPQTATSADTAADPNAAAGVKGLPWNIKFAGRPVYDRKKRKRLSDPQPIEQFSEGGRIVTLPPAAEQLSRRTFHHPEAGLIAQYFPKLYKTRKK